jgi:hypothetical protein
MLITICTALLAITAKSIIQSIVDSVKALFISWFKSRPQQNAMTTGLKAPRNRFSRIIRRSSVNIAWGVATGTFALWMLIAELRGSSPISRGSVLLISVSVSVMAITMLLCAAAVTIAAIEVTVEDIGARRLRASAPHRVLPK